MNSEENQEYFFVFKGRAVDYFLQLCIEYCYEVKDLGTSLEAGGTGYDFKLTLIEI